MKKSIAIVLFTFGLLSPHPGWAMELVEIAGLGPYVAKISNKSINRIALPFPPKDLILQKDAPLEVKIIRNDLFVSVIQHDFTGSIDLYLIFENHDPVAITLASSAIPGETVVLKVPGANKERAVRWEKSVPYEKTLKELVRKMAEDDIPSGYSLEEGATSNISPWKEASIQLQRTFKGASLNGEVYSVVNASKDLMTFDEEELVESLQLKNVRAVAIQIRKLEPGAQSLVYVIRGRVKEESGVK